MITALVSGIFGLVSGVVPDIIKEVRDNGDHKREMAMLQMTHNLQMASLEKQGQMKLADHASELDIADAKVFGENFKALVNLQQNSDSPWIEFINSIMRPITIALILMIWSAIALGYSNVIPAETFGPLMVEMILAVLGYLFGYRATRKTSALG
jgi:hypothetical protein